MDPNPRYEVVNTIASGDFAVVYRARDRELGREVAIKQIHQQFLADERQLARYWQEAQLLAALQHPNVVTIYDIVRSRGWLILELMRGSLRPYAEGEPIDLDFLRLALACALNGLQFLHGNGVIHGDIKPSNLLLDQYHRVKLGDFGLARRATSEEGSLLKGTTKYMAPELASNQFGPVGPASDLYSLGFTAYELMCGGQFESLFPGLEMFGRDRQIAWLMWHTAADRQIPEISRVLQGVPDDLAKVIQRLVVKDQARRYKSAAEVLADLRADRLGAGHAPPPVAAPPKKKRKKWVTLLATFLVSISAVVCAVMLLPQAPEKKKTGPPPPPQGIVRNIYLDERKFVIESSEDGKPREITVRPKDRIMINGKARLLRDLQSGDRVIVKTFRDTETQASLLDIDASRPEVSRGVISVVRPDLGEFTLKRTEGDDKGEPLTISVPQNVRIRFNEREEINHRPVRVADLKPDDRAVVHHLGNDTGGRTATELDVERVVSFEGIVRNVDTAKRELTFATGEGDNPDLLVLPYGDPCEITINERRFLDEKLLKPDDLRPGDRAKVDHDVRVLRVDAHRVLGDKGVVQKIEYSAGTLDVLLEGQPAPRTYLTDRNTLVSLSGEQAQIDDLRTADFVEISHDTPDAKTPLAKTISARRPAEPKRFALLIANGSYEDVVLAPLPFAVGDARMLQSTLTKRYGVPDNQVQLFGDESKIRLEQGIPPFLAGVPADGKLIVYFNGHAFLDADGQVYLAPKNFSARQVASSGLPLQWLVDQLEQCPATEKLLFLDTSHDVKSTVQLTEPASADAVRTLKAPVGYAPLRTVTVIASCRAGQQGHAQPEKQHGLFAQSLADGYGGKADKNRDNRIEPTELFGFVTTDMATASGLLQKQQTPELFLPDARPPRLSDDAKKGIRKLAAYLRLDKLDVDSARKQYDTAQAAAGKELEPKLLFSLLLMKTKATREEAFRTFQEIASEHADQWLPYQGMAWVQFEKFANAAGVEQLADLAKHLPKPKNSSDSYSERVQRVLVWAGQLREFATTAAQEGRRAPEAAAKAVDEAVKDLGPEAERFYEQGRAKTNSIAKEFEKKISTATDEAAVAKYKIERRQLPQYASFPFDDAGQEVLSGIDK